VTAFSARRSFATKRRYGLVGGRLPRTNSGNRRERVRSSPAAKLVATVTGEFDRRRSEILEDVRELATVARYGTRHRPRATAWRARVWTAVAGSQPRHIFAKSEKSEAQRIGGARSGGEGSGGVGGDGASPEAMFGWAMEPGGLGPGTARRRQLWRQWRHWTPRSAIICSEAREHSSSVAWAHVGHGCLGIIKTCGRGIA
jgi:hypothetical protein